MSTIVTRAGKGSPLTNAEVDSNFTNLNTDKVESITSADGSVVVSSSGTTRDLSVGVAGSTATLISQVRNETGATLTKGTVVYISGAAGNKAVVSKAIATGDSTSAQTYGMVQADIPHNQNGYVVVVGAVSGLNTSAFTDGTQLYLSGVSAGGYTNTKPYAPTHLVYVGVVTYSHNTQGTIQVKIQNGYEMDEIHDVSARSPVDGQTLVYVSSTGLWTKTDQSAMSVGSAATLATARNINGVSFNGSADITVADATKLPLTGGTLTGKLTLDGRNEIYGVPTNAGTIAGFMGGTSGGTTAARTQSLNTQTLLNVAAIGYTGSAWVGGAGLSFVATENITAANRGTKAVLTAIAAGDSVATTMEFNGSALTINGSTAVTSSNYNTYAPTKTGTGASGTWGINITGNAATATSATDSTKLPLAGGTLTGKVTFPSANADKPQMPNGFLGLDTGDANFDIWGISRDYYPSNATAANAWGIRWDGDSNQIRFIGGGSVRVSFDLDDGATQINSNTVLHAGNYNSYALPLSGGTMTGHIGHVRGSHNYFERSSGVAVGALGWHTDDVFYVAGHPGYGPNAGNNVKIYGFGGALTFGNNTYGDVFSMSSSGQFQVARRLGVATIQGVTGGSGSDGQMVIDSASGQTLYLNHYNGGTVVAEGGNRVLNASNYSNYALPLTGGTVTGQVQLTADLQGHITPTLYVKGDIRTQRGTGNTGVIYFGNSGSTYLYYDGSNYYMPSGQLVVGGNTVLTAGNYTSYSPSLTGSGASGTWSINVTGNANSASTLNSGATINGTAYFRKNQTDGNYTTATLWTESYGTTTTGIAFHISGVVGKFLEMRTNGTLYWNSDVILHSGNYTNYAAAASHSHNYIPINPDGDGNSWAYADNNPVINGVGVGGGQLFGADGSVNEGFLQAKLLNAYNGFVNSANGYYVGNSDFSGIANTASTTRIIDGSGNITAAQVQSSGNSGFKSDVYYSSVRNPIWYFGNASTYGISYFQGSSGRDGSDTIGLHPNGTASATGSSFAVNSSNAFVNNNIVLNAANYSSYAVPQSDVALNGGSKVLKTASNGYLDLQNWINVAGTGIYSSTTNGSHWLPNDGTYGSWKAIGTRNGWAGIEFGNLNNGAVVLMVYPSSNETGFHNNAYGWQFRWSDGTAYVHKSSYGGGTSATVLDSSNYTSYSPSLTGSGASGTWGISVTGNAATAGGLAVHDTQGTQNSANQIVRTQVNGYTMLGWINTTSGDSGIENRLTRIYSSNDGYVRYSTLTDFKVHMGLSAKNSYSRRIDYTSDANYHVGSMGHNGYGANETFHGGSGFFDIWSGTNYPPSTSHIHGFNALHYTTNSLGSTGGNAYGIQVAGQYDQGGLLFSRACSGGSFSSWRRQIDDNNYSSYALPLSGGTLSGVLTLSGNNYADFGPNSTWGATLRVGGNGHGGAGRASVVTTNGNLHLDGSTNNGIYLGWYNSGTSGVYFGNGAAGQVGRIDGGGNASFSGSITSAGNTVLNAGNYTSYSPSLGGSGASGTWGISITGNAATVGSKGSSAFHQRVHYGTGSGLSGYFKIRILPATSWMMSFIIRIYQAYQSYDIRVSGYNYGGYYWYSPEATLMDSTNTAVDVQFGYDSAYNLWVAVPASNYAGVDIVSVTNGYTQVDANYADQFAIEYQTSLTGSIQTTVTAYRPLRYNEAAAGSNYLQGYQWMSSGKDVRGSQFYCDNWFRNYNTNTGLYNEATSAHWYSENNGSWTAAPVNSSYGEIRLRQGHQGAYKGSFYWDGSGIGLLNDQGGWSVRCGQGSGYGGTLFGTWNGGNIRANRANGNLYIDDNYGNGVVGVYSSYRYQGVFAMGDSYKMSADGTSLSNMYGIAWSHPNAGGAAGNLTDHGMLIINAGSFKCAISNSIVASANITAYSDERLKTNWQPMPEDYVTRLAKVKVGIYDRTDQENITQVGVSAQSFQNLLPQAIMTAKDEMQTLSVNYGGAALASAVELAKEVVDLRTRVAHLESLINKLIGD